MTNEVDDTSMDEAQDLIRNDDIPQRVGQPVSLADQIKKYLRWNEPYELDLTPGELEAIDLTRTSDLKAGDVDLIACYLPDKDGVGGVQRTFDTFARIMADEQQALFDDGKEHTWRWNQLMSDPGHLQMLDGYEHRPGLRQVVFNRTAFYDPIRGRTLEEVRAWSAQAGLTLAASEVLMDAAVDPNAAQTMDGTTNPYRDMAAYQVNLPDNAERWSSCPYLHYAAEIRRVGLYAYFFDSSCRVMSAPVVRERSNRAVQLGAQDLGTGSTE